MKWIQLCVRPLLTGAACLPGVAFLGSPVAADPSSGINALPKVASQKANLADQEAIDQAKANNAATPAPAPARNPGPVRFEGPSRAQMLSDSRVLIARAEQLRARYHPAAGAPSVAELQASTDELKSQVDSLSEMSETESLRMQIAMDRLSKMMSTLSNLLKKARDTDNSITQNMK